MMMRLFASLLVLLQGFSTLIPSAAAVQNVPLPGAISGTALCLPGIYAVDPQDCLPLGPSSYLTRLASVGINLPLTSLRYTPIEATLGDLPFSYATLGEGPTPAYATLEDAIAGKDPVRTIEAGKLRFVSYVDFQDTDQGRFFRLRDDTWVLVSSRVSVPHSYPGGIEFTQAPVRPFGWVLPFAATVKTKFTPGYASDDYTGRSLSQYQIVQIYSSLVVKDEEWDLVAPDEWIEGRYIGKVIPDLTPPEGVTNGRWIAVNLFEQTMTVYDQGQLVFATLIATGLPPFYTKPGLFQIQKKLDSTLMSGSFEGNRSDYYYLEDVPFTMYYDNARALHGAYWRTAFGFPQSHGCVNLAPADSHWLFNWANVGDWVYVWDPSGKTPTDPSFYGEGGA